MTMPDPFASRESVPSLSFKDAPVGTTYTLVVTEPPRLVQSRKFPSGEPLFWQPNRGGKGTTPTAEPVMSAVVNGTLPTGEERSLWAEIPSSMHKAISDAQKAAGVQIGAGGTLVVQFTGTEPASTPGLNDRKLYAASYTPPANGGAFGSALAAAPVAPVVSPPPVAPVAAPAVPVAHSAQVAAAILGQQQPAPAAPVAPVPVAAPVAQAAPPAAPVGGQVINAAQAAALANLGVDLSAFTVVG